MIIKFLLDIILYLGTGLFTLITSLFPSSNIDPLSLMLTIFSFCSQANNFCYFLFGYWFILLVPVVFTHLFIKLLVLPIISFVRGFIRLGGS